MKKLLTAAALLALLAGTSLLYTNPVYADTNPRLRGIPTHWTSAAEQITLTVIDAEPAFADFDSDCVLDEIQDEFASPRNFVRYASRPGADTSPRVMSIAFGVLSNCEPAS